MHPCEKKSHTSLSDDNTCLLSSKSAYYTRFTRIMWLKIGVMMLKIQLCHHRN